MDQPKNRSRRTTGHQRARRAKLVDNPQLHAAATRGGNLEYRATVAQWKAEYVAIRYTERLAEAGAVASVGSKGDSYDNAMAEAVNGRLEHLRGSALGFRNLTNYIARSLLETGGFRPRLHPGL